jgi:RNA-directed DNA polymerase
LRDGRLGIAPESLSRAQERVRQITRRNRGVSLGQAIHELNEYLSGWITYFRCAGSRGLRGLEQWLRRKLRCLRLKQRKRPKPIADLLRSLGVPEWRAWILAGSGKGWWRMAGRPKLRKP